MRRHERRELRLRRAARQPRALTIHQQPRSRRRAKAAAQTRLAITAVRLRRPRASVRPPGFTRATCRMTGPCASPLCRLPVPAATRSHASQQKPSRRRPAKACPRVAPRSCRSSSATCGRTRRSRAPLPATDPTSRASRRPSPRASSITVKSRRDQGRRHRRHARGEDHVSICTQGYEEADRRDTSSQHDHVQRQEVRHLAEQLLLRRRARRRRSASTFDKLERQGHEPPAHEGHDRRERVARGSRRSTGRARRPRARARSSAAASSSSSASSRRSEPEAVITTKTGIYPRRRSSALITTGRVTLDKPLSPTIKPTGAAGGLDQPAVARRGRRRRAVAQQLRAHVPARRRRS